MTPVPCPAIRQCVDSGFLKAIEALTSDGDTITVYTFTNKGQFWFGAMPPQTAIDSANVIPFPSPRASSRFLLQPIGDDGP